MIQQPSVLSPVLTAKNTLERYWYSWVDQITKATNLDYGSGTTADRPTGTLLTGARYFDTTLGLPIWWNGTIWIKADGTAA